MCNSCRLIDFCRSHQTNKNVGVYAGADINIIQSLIYEKFITCVFLADEIENFPNPERRNGDELNNNSKRKRAVGETATEHGDEAISRRRLVGITADGYTVCAVPPIYR